MKTKVAREIARDLAMQAHQMLKIEESLRAKKINNAAYKYMIALRVDAVEAILERLKFYRDEEYKNNVF